MGTPSDVQDLTCLWELVRVVNASRVQEKMVITHQQHGSRYAASPHATEFSCSAWFSSESSPAAVARRDSLCHAYPAKSGA